MSVVELSSDIPARQTLDTQSCLASEKSFRRRAASFSNRFTRNARRHGSGTPARAAATTARLKHTVPTNFYGTARAAVGSCAYSGEARLLSYSISLAGPSRCSVGLATVCSMGLCRAAIKVGALLNSKRLVMNIANDMRLRL
jgi:hypothetical protein